MMTDQPWEITHDALPRPIAQYPGDPFRIRATLEDDWLMRHPAPTEFLQIEARIALANRAADVVPHWDPSEIQAYRDWGASGERVIIEATYRKPAPFPPQPERKP